MLGPGLESLREQVLQCHDPLAQSCARRSFARLFTTRTRRGLARTFRWSARETDVMWLLLQGLRNPEIAAELGLKVTAVYGSVDRAFRRMNVDCRERAILKMVLVSGALLAGEQETEL